MRARGQHMLSSQKPLRKEENHFLIIIEEEEEEEDYNSLWIEGDELLYNQYIIARNNSTQSDGLFRGIIINQSLAAYPS
jgi:hypothetical protein